MKDIIVVYDERSKEIIDKMDVVKDFKKDLDEGFNKVNNFKYNNRAVYKLLHPVKLIKNCTESLRLKNIKSSYNYYYNASVLTYVTEETGDLQVDLGNAAFKEKPRYIEGYIKSLKLKK